jgi:magnesium transporter
VAAFTIAAMETWSCVDGSWSEGDAPGAAVRWFIVEGPEAESLEALRARFRLHPLAIEDCLSPNLHAPKIDEFRDHIFIVVMSPVEGDAGAVEEFDVFLGEDFLVTYSDQPLAHVGRVREALATGGRQPRPGPDGLLYEIVDRMVDDFLPAANVMGDELDRLEDDILRNARQEHSRAIMDLRGRGGRLRRLLAPQLMVIQRLSRGEFRYVHEANLIYFRDIYDHLVRIDLALEGVREDAEMALSTYLSTLNNRMNEVMKVLSLVAALALPATVIAGIFGTNFDNVPGLHSNWGFALMLGAMGALGVSMAWYFKRRGWW